MMDEKIINHAKGGDSFPAFCFCDIKFFSGKVYSCIHDRLDL